MRHQFEERGEEPEFDLDTDIEDALLEKVTMARQMASMEDDSEYDFGREEEDGEDRGEDDDADESDEWETDGSEGDNEDEDMEDDEEDLDAMPDFIA
jgi:hypothetical protein